MSERVSDLEVIKQFARMNTGIANMIACDLLDARAERDENGAEIMRRKESEDKWADAACRAEARVKELEEELKSWQDRAYEIQETINACTDRVKELEEAVRAAKKQEESYVGCAGWCDATLLILERALRGEE